MRMIKRKEFMFWNRTGVMRVRSIHHIVDGEILKGFSCANLIKD